jgi:hypothetical protein
MSAASEQGSYNYRGKAHGSGACGALILQSVLQIRIKRLIRSPASPRRFLGFPAIMANPTDPLDADPLEAAGRQTEDAPLLRHRCATHW